MTVPLLSIVDSLQRHLLQTLPPASSYWVAFSGGMDSHVLLHALQALQAKLSAPIGVVHVHHGLQQQADEWDIFCEQTANSYALEYVCLPVEVDRQHADGLEAAARQARYAALKNWLPNGSVLLTAHHQRDQAETLLLQLLRGSGPRGLAAMPYETTFGQGVQLRPLLEMPYQQLRDYADEVELDWIDDPSNDSLQFDRNLLRHNLMPLLRERWSGLDQVLARVARHQAGASQLLDELAQIDLRGASGSQPNTLSCEVLLSLPLPRRHNLLRFWIHSRGLRLPSEQVLARITPELLESREDAEPRVHWPDAELRRYQQDLYVMSPLDAVDPDWTGVLPEQVVDLPGGGRLCRRQQLGAGIAEHHLARGQWQIRYRQGGERIKPVGSPHTRSLKQLFQEHGLPPWLRQRVPLVYCDDRLVAVAQLWTASGFEAAEGEQGVLFHWSEIV